MDTHTELLPEPLPSEPMTLIAHWMDESRSRRLQPNTNAMVLATTTPDGRPSARVVLCKAISATQGYLVFFTNYQSRKGRELTNNPRVAAVIHWDHLHRQIRVEGVVVKAPATESDAYFESRPWQSRVGAWASQQSQPIESRKALIDVVAQTAQRFGAPDVSPVPRPPHWGGFHLWIDTAEIWTEGEARIHDRARWTRTLVPQGEAFHASAWTATRLQP